MRVTEASGGYFIEMAELPARERRPGIHVRAAWMERMTLSQVTLQPNAAVPSHQHPAEQATIVMSGSLTMRIGAETRQVFAGDCYLIPGGVEHSGIAGPDGACLVDVFTPVREDYQD